MIEYSGTWKESHFEFGCRTIAFQICMLLRIVSSRIFFKVPPSCRNCSRPSSADASSLSAITRKCHPDSVGVAQCLSERHIRQRRSDIRCSIRRYLARKLMIGSIGRSEPDRFPEDLQCMGNARENKKFDSGAGIQSVLVQLH